MTIIIIYFSRPVYHHINNRNDFWNQKQNVNKNFELLYKQSTEIFQ